MDPELSRVLTIIVAALIGVGGAVLGAWVNQRGTQAAAERTLLGQRVLARDAAQRDWLLSASRTFLESFPRRQVSYNRLMHHVLAGRAAEAATLLHELEETQELLGFTALIGLDDPELAAAVSEHVEAEQSQLSAARELVAALQSGTTGDALAWQAGETISQVQRVLVRRILPTPP